MLWTRHRQNEMHARVVRLLRADLRESRQHRAQLAAELVKTIRRADAAEAEVTIAREALTAGHRELLAENQRLRDANKLLNRQLNDAMGYGPHELAVIDAGGEQALAVAEKAARELPKVAAK